MFARDALLAPLSPTKRFLVGYHRPVQRGLDPENITPGYQKCFGDLGNYIV
jgi:hypothetical protein